MIQTVLRLLTYFLFLMTVYSCRSDQEFTSNPPDFNEIPDQESWNATLTSTSQGKVTSKIKYVRMERFSKKRISKFFQGVEIDLFDSEGKHTAKIKSQDAVLNEITKRIEFTGSVVVQSDDGFDLRTEKLVWDDYKDKIFSDTLVTVVTAENDTIYGKGFEAKKSLQDWSVKQPWGVTQKKLNMGLSHSGSPSNELD